MRKKIILMAVLTLLFGASVGDWILREELDWDEVKINLGLVKDNFMMTVQGKYTLCVNSRTQFMDCDWSGTTKSKCTARLDYRQKYEAKPGNWERIDDVSLKVVKDDGDMYIYQCKKMVN